MKRLDSRLMTAIAALSVASSPVWAVEVELQLVADGLIAPTDLRQAPDGSGRLFVTEQTGQVLIIDDGVLQPTPFLDISSRMTVLNPFYEERGLLGIAFHPGFANNGRFFLRYSAPGGADHLERLAEYALDPLDSNQADPDSEIVLFEVDEPEFNHNGGGMDFGPDGYLYFGLGDGGGEGDELANPALPHGPLGNGQDVTTALGAMLRIDVDSPPDPGLAYAIPDDNPFVDGAGLDEIFAFGFRNPYRFSFDDGPGGDGALYVADVGQNLFEELNIVVSGGNYGWATREALHCFDPFAPGSPPDVCATTGPDGEPLLDPVLEYAHSEGISVIGGFVYRGSGIPELVGRYFFGDYSINFGALNGSLFYTDLAGPAAFELNPLLPAGGALGASLRSIAEDIDGELYLLSSQRFGPDGDTGAVYRLVADTDGDGVNNLQDNCTNVVNADQRDSNGDGYGNLCDPDLDGNEQIDFADLVLMKAVFFSDDEDADLDGSGAVDFADLVIMKGMFFGVPGPSGLAP